jgi:serine/threonine protein kinase
VAGFVHRAVKPANILVASDRVVLTDFGIARLSGPESPQAPGRVVVGSAGYLAPERARGEESGPADDLWGLGASLYAAVEGHGPFDRNGELATMTAVLTDEPAPAARAGELWPVISGLLRKDPRERLDAADAERMLCDVCAAPVAPEESPAVPVVLASKALRPHRLPAPPTRPEAPARRARPARGRHSASRRSPAPVRHQHKQQPERMRLFLTLAMTVLSGERAA